MGDGADDERGDHRPHPDREEERNDRNKPADRCRDARRQRRPPGIRKRLFGEAELFLNQRPEELLGLFLDLLRHGARLFRRKPLQLIEQLELEQFLVRVFLDLGPLPGDLRLVDFAL